MNYISNKPLVASAVALLLFVATLAISTVRTAHADSTVSKSGERLLVIHDGSVDILYSDRQRGLAIAPAIGIWHFTEHYSTVRTAVFL